MPLLASLDFGRTKQNHKFLDKREKYARQTRPRCLNAWGTAASAAIASKYTSHAVCTKPVGGTIFSLSTPFSTMTGCHASLVYGTDALSDICLNTSSSRKDTGTFEAVLPTMTRREQTTLSRCPIFAFIYCLKIWTTREELWAWPTGFLSMKLAGNYIRPLPLMNHQTFRPCSISAALCLLSPGSCTRATTTDESSTLRACSLPARSLY